jgi:hypothetical protein
LATTPEAERRRLADTVDSDMNARVLTFLSDYGLEDDELRITPK